jgi:hypothetical protein
MSTMLVGPYTGRFFGNLPIIYQKFLLDNIKRIHTESSKDGTLCQWLTSHATRINRQVRTVPTIKFMEQMKAMEVLCGLEFQPRSVEIITSTTCDNVGGTRVEEKLSTNTHERQGTTALELAQPIGQSNKGVKLPSSKT